MQTQTRNLYPVTLEASGIELVLAELRPSELLNALRSAGDDQSVTYRGIKVGVEGLRYSIREVAGKPVEYQDLVGPGWRTYFPRTRQAMALVGAWTLVHMPTQDDLDKIKRSMSPKVEGLVELWTLTLPAQFPKEGEESDEDDPSSRDRVIVMEEGDLETVGEALRTAEASSRAASAVGFASTLESLRRSIKSVDGAAVDLKKDRGFDAIFSTRDVFLLGAVWDEIHQGGGEVAKLGEARSPSGAA